MLDRLCFNAKLIKVLISFEIGENIDKVSVIYKRNFGWEMKRYLRKFLRFVSWGNEWQIKFINFEKGVVYQYRKYATFHISNIASTYSLYVIGFHGSDKVSETGAYFLHLKMIVMGVMKAYSEPCQTSKMQLSVKIVNGF